MKFPNNRRSSLGPLTTRSSRETLRSRRSGFTLIELMVASVVLILGITSAVATLQVGMRTIDNARATTIAGQIIQSEIERIRLLGWADVSSMDLDEEEEVPIAQLFPSSPQWDALKENLETRFNATRRVSVTPDRGGDMRTITITVTWTGSEGGTHVRSSTTRYTNNGLYDYYYTRALR